MRAGRVATTGLLAALLAAPACGGDDGGDDGPSAEPFSIERSVGECFDRPASPDAGEVPEVPCDEPHDLEAFAEVELPEGPYPGQAPLAEQAGTRCESQFEAYVGSPPDLTGNLLVVPFTPDRAAWEDGDQRVLCAVSQAEGQLTESVQGRGTGA